MFRLLLVNVSVFKGQSMFDRWAAAIISSQRPFSCILLYFSTLRVIYFNLGCQELFCCILFVYFLLESELFQCREPISLLFTGSHFWETLTVLEKPQTSWWPKLYFFFAVLTRIARRKQELRSLKIFRLRWEIISPSSWPEWLQIDRLFRKMNNETPNDV